MLLQLENVIPLGSGVYVVDVDPNDVARIGHQEGEVPTAPTVLYAGQCQFRPETRTLNLRMSELTLLSRDSSSTAIIVCVREENYPEQNSDSQTNTTACDNITSYTDACHRYLTGDVLDISLSFVQRLDETLNFSLIEGKARKWTAYPNFLAITIQNRNQQLLVSVKGNPRDMNYRTIKPKLSRSPYCEFHLHSYEQLDEAVDVALKSAER